MIAELLGTGSLRAPTILIQNYFGSNNAAYYGTSLRIVLTPIILFTGPIGQIFLERISKRREKAIHSKKIFYIFFEG